MFLKRPIHLILLCLFVFAGASSAFSKDAGYIISVQFENDFFGGSTDRHFSHGTRIECLTPPIPWISEAADKVPWFSSETAKYGPEDALKARASFSLGQNIYTPEDTATRQPVLDDRPYAGWLYLGFGLVANQGDKRYDKLQLEVGVVGPASMAEEVQTFWHSILGIDVPRGWDNQLENEPGAVLYYEQARRLPSKRVFLGLSSDVIPHFGASLGNVFTHGAAGMTFRVGSNLEKDFGPPRIRPSLPGGGYYHPVGGMTWYLFAGVEGRVVLRNVFLDGNTFTDSHSIEKNMAVGDLQAGLAVQWGRFRASYTQIFRTREFEGQDQGNIFGALSLSYHF